MRLRNLHKLDIWMYYLAQNASLVKAETQRGASFMDLFLVVNSTLVGGGGRGQGAILLFWSRRNR